MDPLTLLRRGKGKYKNISKCFYLLLEQIFNSLIDFPELKEICCHIKSSIKKFPGDRNDGHWRICLYKMALCPVIVAPQNNNIIQFFYQIANQEEG
ncbi:hypothetical protein M0813_20434 [Anaeramoeba flamelloides]|uniref:Uncharacterized protein n=1 Tax=Anaeramoeba flamelloides TaxID=1746091 RepID=A0ABQ8YLH6_9EUKA|nr:hypothetical protein M0813_20434 [Anaeramoeba flamelloides]